MKLTGTPQLRMTKLFSKTVFMTLVSAFAITTAPNATAEDGAVVVYTVTSNGPLSSVSFLDASNSRQQVVDVIAPWSMTFTSQQVNPPVAVEARSTGTEISCTITIDGRIIDRDSDQDGTPDVDCHEDVDD
jgi:hypothetical protein